MIAGWRCAVCGAMVDIAEPLAFRCPNATPDDPHHVLHLVGATDAPPIADPETPTCGSVRAWRGGRSPERTG